MGDAIVGVVANVLKNGPLDKPVTEMFSVAGPRRNLQAGFQIAARTTEGLYEAVGEALDYVTIRDILGWFSHSGLYATHS